ncbi:hypothetical protein EZS27_008173 [termite gut metagenome]|uniref:Uncharacterized protein n=1 Tax=termite gut metagenome TaxID=433724 RepID=A0A5J4SEM2_9ZZZZ
MRNGIKILIALFFIIISFSLGQYLNIIKINDDMNQYKNEIDSLKSENSHLKDSTSILQNHIDSILKINTIGICGGNVGKILSIKKAKGF